MPCGDERVKIKSGTKHFATGESKFITVQTTYRPYLPPSVFWELTVYLVSNVAAMF